MAAATFDARYAGTCHACPTRIGRGDEVTYDGADGLIHVTCPEDALAHVGEVCTGCFMEKPLTGVCPTC